ncbi:ATP-binding cassette domain-containing protein [Leifsonia sp. 2MCAF36]|uniref:ATP-binding cassette domain-containing protein n=1 Tax=Leifsonia sp. 2MCAF36 TaxID=3232988 RepID=UPI003F9D1147
MITLERLSKRYGERLAVNEVSAVIEPGRVTGFLGPNGAGKSTTMRMIMGFDRPDGGTALVGGKRYAELHAPLRSVGALLDAKAAHPGRSARQHLRALAATNRIPRRRVDEVIEMAGLGSVADKRVGGFSLGMGQRLGIATAMLGDPGVLILDEPVNGLDPDGVRWVREFTRSLAAEGRTVFLSSHLMTEMAQTADHVIVLGRGRVLADSPIGDLVARASGDVVRVRSPRVRALTAILVSPDVSVTEVRPDTVEISGVAPEIVGEAAATAGIPLYELVPVRASLEEAYLELTADDIEYRTGVAR